MTFSLASALINSFPLDQVGVFWSLLVLTLLTHYTIIHVHSSGLVCIQINNTSLSCGYT